MWLGVDTGGTFTDFVLNDGRRLRLHKVLSTPDNPAAAIAQGLAELGLDAHAISLVHGSTVATNAILERKGVRTLFITNRGLEDLMPIGRQTRPRLYDLTPAIPPRWPEAGDCLGVSARTGADGRELAPLTAADLAAIRERAAGYEAVAVCLLFSFLDPGHEQAIAGALPETLPVSLSSRVLPEQREYERAATTFLNAYVAPQVARYLGRLRQDLPTRELLVMHSAGGLMTAGDAAEHAVRLVLSGPAGGLAAAQAIGASLAIPRLISFDMGGTSTDVALLDGEPTITTESQLAGLPVAVPMLDIHTIGAGGGSLAWTDAAGLLQLGPESAGAMPGPACYGRGGLRPTVTDANLVLGRLPAGTLLGGHLPLAPDAARRALGSLAGELGLGIESLAEGMLALAEEKMAGALRTVSEQRGHDPADFALVSFGGAGGLHACALAERMRIRRLVVPAACGAFSALGMLCSPRRFDASRSWPLSLDRADAAAIADLYAELEADNAGRMPGHACTHQRLAELRYAGQGATLSLPWTADMRALREDFEALHARRYGHRLDMDVELTTLRVRTLAAAPGLALPALTPSGKAPQPAGESPVHGLGMVPHYRRRELAPGQRLVGPAIILEPTATTWLAPAWALSVSDEGHLLLERGA
jgi:N-methylhydantoinase A